MSGTCDLPYCTWEQELGVLAAFVNPADGNVPKHFKESRMLSCNGNIINNLIRQEVGDFGILDFADLMPLLSALA